MICRKGWDSGFEFSHCHSSAAHCRAGGDSLGPAAADMVAGSICRMLHSVSERCVALLIRSG